MIRGLLKLIVIVVVLVAAAMFFLGYRFGGDVDVRRDEAPVGTSGQAPAVDTSKARETGAAVGEKVAQGANDAKVAVANASLSAKIKSKMALDDVVKAANIDVDSANGVVTLTGTVHSEAERARAVQLARETDGVSSVKDQLVVR